MLVSLSLVCFSFASIGTETQYTIVTSPNVSSSPSLKNTDEVSTTVISQNGLNREIPEINLEDEVSINVLENGKTFFKNIYI